MLPANAERIVVEVPIEFSIHCTAVDALQKFLEWLNECCRPLEDNEVVVLEDDQFALTHDAMMLFRGGNRHQRILSAMNNQHRAFVSAHYRPKAPLVGVIEISGVLYIQLQMVEESEVRD